MPLLPKRVDGRVLIDASEPVLPEGTEVLAIDGTPIDTLLAELAALALVDGDRLGARLARVERDFTLHFHLARGTASEYAVDVRLPDGEERRALLPAAARDTLGMLRDRRLSAAVWGAEGPERLPLPFLVPLSGGAILLRLASFGVGDQDVYRQRVDELFATLAGDETLVLDLRGNPGGLRTNGIAVLEHLIDGPYAQWTSIATFVRGIPERFAAQVTFSFSPATALTEFPGEFRGDRYVYEGDPLADRMPGAGGRHRGRVVVFIDDATNSAANEMIAALLWRRPEVAVIRAETIGECGRHVGEIPVMFTSPGLGVRVLFSLAELTHVPARGCAPGRGFVPDAPVRYTMSDFLGGSDPYLDALATLLRAERARRP